MSFDLGSIFRVAEGRVLRETGSKALTNMRGLLRSESETIRRDVSCNGGSELVMRTGYYSRPMEV